jgi:hypothetical protein
VRLIGIAMFFATLCLPALFFATGSLDRFAIDENRTRAAWPRTGFVQDPVAYSTAAQAWFDDHFGGRDFLIRLKTQIDYSLFDTSTRVHLGQDSWLFYRSVLDQEKPRMERQLAVGDTALAEGIGHLAQELKARNVQLILMPIFLADIFYPDKLPRSVPALPQPSRFSQAVERWRHIPDVTIFDSAPILRELQATRPIFYKTDFHWNEPAAFEVAHGFVDMIGLREGLEHSLWDHRLEIEKRPYSGKEATFLPLFSTPSEDGLFVKPTWNEPSLTYVGNQGIYEWTSEQTAPNRPTLPTLCAIGDSFFDGLSASGFPAYFRKIYFIRWRSETNLYDLLAQLPPDCRYVLLEFIETQFPAIDGLTKAASIWEQHDAPGHAVP